MSDVLTRLERIHLEPPCPRSKWVICAQCSGELLDEDAYWDNRDNPYCSEHCLESGPFDAHEEYLQAMFGEDEGDEIKTS